MATFKDSVKSCDTTTGLAACTNAGGDSGPATPVVRIAIVGAANAAAANVLTITNASFAQATTLTIRDPGVAAASLQLAAVAGFEQETVTNITAGTTQTQAGATAITSSIVVVTTGVAGDGVILPALSAAKIGTRVQLINGANAGRVYCPGTTSTNTIDGTAGATGVVYAASKTLFLVAVSATAWVSTLSN